MRKYLITRWGTLVGGATMAVALLAAPGDVPAQLAAGSAFSHQGSLTDGGNPANGTYDFEFRFFRAVTGGTQVGTTQTVSGVSVVDGLYSARIDFGDAVFNGEPAFLQIAVRRSGQTTYTTLTPRHELTPTPYALFAGRAATAATADSATNATNAENAQNAQNAVNAQTAETATTATTAQNLAGNAISVNTESNNAGRLRVLGANGDANVTLGSVSGTSDNAPNRGRLAVQSTSGDSRVEGEVISTGVGVVRVKGPNNSNNVVMSALGSDNNAGFLAVLNSNGQTRGEFYSDSINSGHMVLYNFQGTAHTEAFANGVNAGQFNVYGPNGSRNVQLSDSVGGSNRGGVGIFDGNGNSRAAMFVNASNQGVVSADVKTFVEDYPGRPDARIVYVSLEGPEAGMYARGRATLENGRASVGLPDHFLALAALDTVTVQLTPGSADSPGVAFVGIEDGEVLIEELGGGNGSYDVHYLVIAEREAYVGWEPVVERDNMTRRSVVDPFDPMGNSGKDRERDSGQIAEGGTDE